LKHALKTKSNYNSGQGPAVPPCKNNWLRATGYFPPSPSPSFAAQSSNVPQHTLVLKHDKSARFKPCIHQCHCLERLAVFQNYPYLNPYTRFSFHSDTRLNP